MSASTTAAAYQRVRGHSAPIPPMGWSDETFMRLPMLHWVRRVRLCTTGPGLAAANCVGVRVNVAAADVDGEPDLDADCDPDAECDGVGETEVLGEVEREANAVDDIDGEVDGDMETSDEMDNDAVAEADEDELLDGVSDEVAEVVSLELAVADDEDDEELVDEAVALAELEGDGDAVAEEDDVAVPVLDVLPLLDGDDERVAEADRVADVDGDTDTDGEVLIEGVAVGVTHDTISATICAPDNWLAPLVVNVRNAAACVILTSRALAATVPSEPEACHTSGMEALEPSYTLSTSWDASVVMMISRSRICQPGGTSPRCSSSEQVTCGGYCERRLVITSTGAPTDTTTKLLLLSSADVEHIGAIEDGSGGTASAINCTPDSWPPLFDVKRRNADGPVVLTWRPYNGKTSYARESCQSSGVEALGPS